MLVDSICIPQWENIYFHEFVVIDGNANDFFFFFSVHEKAMFIKDHECNETFKINFYFFLHFSSSFSSSSSIFEGRILVIKFIWTNKPLPLVVICYYRINFNLMFVKDDFGSHILLCSRIRSLCFVNDLETNDWLKSIDCSYERFDYYESFIGTFIQRGKGNENLLQANDLWKKMICSVFFLENISRLLEIAINKYTIFEIRSPIVNGFRISTILPIHWIFAAQIDSFNVYILIFFRSVGKLFSIWIHFSCVQPVSQFEMFLLLFFSIIVVLFVYWLDSGQIALMSTMWKLIVECSLPHSRIYVLWWLKTSST